MQHNVQGLRNKKIKPIAIKETPSQVVLSAIRSLIQSIVFSLYSLQSGDTVSSNQLSLLFFVKPAHSRISCSYHRCTSCICRRILNKSSELLEPFITDIIDIFKIVNIFCKNLFLRLLLIIRGSATMRLHSLLFLFYLQVPFQVTF